MKRAVEAEDHSGQRPCHTATGRRWQRDEGRAARLRRSRRSWIGISWLSRIRCPCLPCFGARLPALRSRIAACIPAGLGASFDSFPFLDRIQDRFPVLTRTAVERKTLLHAVTPAAIDRGMASLSTPVQCQPDQLVVHLITTPQFFLLLQPAPAVKPEGIGIISLTSCTVIVNTP